MTIPEPSTDFRPINNMIYKSHLPQIIITALKTGIFDELHNQPATAFAISEKIGLEPAPLKALLKVLHASGYVERTGDEYNLSQLSRDFLVSSSPFYQGEYLIKALSSHPLGRGTEILRNGAQEFDRTCFGNKKNLEQFGQLAKAGAIQELVAFATALPEFGSMTAMCDIAGNYGYISMALLDANPHLESTVYELPEVVRLAKEMAAVSDYGPRLNHIDFDLNKEDSFGTGYDLVLTSHCLYMLDFDTQLRPFARSVNKALNSGGVFISNHMIMDADGDDLLAHTIKEYITRLSGTSTHHLPEEVLTSALEDAGFGDFTIQPGNKNGVFNTMLLAARKS